MKHKPLGAKRGKENVEGAKDAKGKAKRPRVEKPKSKKAASKKAEESEEDAEEADVKDEEMEDVKAPVGSGRRAAQGTKSYKEGGNGRVSKNDMIEKKEEPQCDSESAAVQETGDVASNKRRCATGHMQAYTASNAPGCRNACMQCCGIYVSINAVVFLHVHGIA